jgi:hypothetical protein
VTATKGLRKRAMVYLWRAQQSGAIINILLLGTLTAASLYRLYLKDYFDNFGFPAAQELPGVLITMFIIFASVFGIGFAFDRLKFWKEQNIVGIERNPYGSYKLTAKEIHWIRLWSAAVTAGNPSAKQQETVAHFEKWIERSLAEDSVLRSEVDAVDRWVERGDQSIKTVIDGEG